jgi:hypothetical protein
VPSKSADDDNKDYPMMNRSLEFQPLSTRDFAALGIQAVAYITASARDGQAVYVIHTADGKSVGEAASRDLAFAAIRQHGLEPVSSH